MDRGHADAEDIREANARAGGSHRPPADESGAGRSAAAGARRFWQGPLPQRSCGPKGDYVADLTVLLLGTGRIDGAHRPTGQRLESSRPNVQRTMSPAPAMELLVGSSPNEHTL